MENLVGKPCISTREAPFTEQQHARLGQVLEVSDTHVKVEWTDTHGWKTRATMPRNWIHIDS
jgi:hypothetical protein